MAGKDHTSERHDHDNEIALEAMPISSECRLRTSPRARLQCPTTSVFKERLSECRLRTSPRAFLHCSGPLLEASWPRAVPLPIHWHQTSLPLTTTRYCSPVGICVYPPSSRAFSLNCNIFSQGLGCSFFAALPLIAFNILAT